MNKARIGRLAVLAATFAIAGCEQGGPQAIQPDKKAMADPAANQQNAAGPGKTATKGLQNGPAPRPRPGG